MPEEEIFLGKILIVDDSEVNLELLRIVLFKNSYEVITSSSGQGGYETACKELPDLILLDISMPDVDGFEVCKMLKENPETANIPVVFLTASDDKGSILKGFKYGAVDYLTKPFNKLELLSRVSVHLKLQLTLKQIEYSENNYKLLFNNMTNGFAFHRIMCDQNGNPYDYKFLQVNPAFEKLTGLKMNEILNKSILDILPNTEREWIDIYGKVALTGEPVHFDNYSSELDKYYDAVAFSPKKYFFATLFSDVTEKKNAEKKMLEYNDTLERTVREKTKELADALKKQEDLTKELEASLHKEKELGELKTKFVSMASHEFKTPLTTIMSTCDILINFRSRYDDEKITEKLKGIKNEVIHMTKMIESILHMGKPLEKETPLAVEPVDLKSFIETMVYDFRITDNFRHKITINIENNLAVLTDNVRLKMIMNNLISNALKYSTESTDIIITAKRKNGFIDITVRDFGIGIPKDQIGKMFEPFHRFSNVGNIKGTGLGLSIIKREAEIMGGSVYYNSEIEAGSEFTVSIPEKHS